MNRLQAEWRRLYLPAAAASEAAGAEPTAPALAGGRTRALVLALAAPGAWDGVRAVWQGVQADLQLPAPAIAVAGSAGYQLWFSLAEAVPADQALAFLAALRSRYLGAARPERIATFPADAAAPAGGAPRLPPHEIGPGRWSAFVATDLAALFNEEPWLDLPPSAEAQADLLSRVQSTALADWQRARERLAAAVVAEAAPAAAIAVASADPAAAPGAQHEDARRFLLGIMNDPAVALNLRIEAAKALLPCHAGPRAC
ncbi:hypothetical protein [Ramlibacter sp.]|uniref:hypothetical protein n=1 Tax=Ramlibacter sp. TaxID=1917967 RepID=UPI00261DD6EA|nr:hypothetical protein [Ramlibacter sp.]MDB5958078.1 hypothetical protein [Ramlibacter sp.]